MFEAGLAKGRQDRREGGWERALTPQAQVDGKEPRCNGESEPPRRALSPGPEGERRGGCVVRLRGMKIRTRAFYEELRSFSNPQKMTRIRSHASARFDTMT